MARLHGGPLRVMSDALDEVLERSRELGFLGPGPVDEQRAHAAAFLDALDPRPAALAIDLGSGGGVPGLVLATLLPTTHWVLLDAMQRRTAFLREAVELLGLGGRVMVHTARAEAAGRDPAFRATADLVVARGFGAPALTAECAAPFLRPGGLLVVSEPPGSTGDRWQVEPLARLGLHPDGLVAGPPSFMRLRQRALAPAEFPRRAPKLVKRPLW
jgi:16S rRNA (guanine527-N7)-methyltransferase